MFNATSSSTMNPLIQRDTRAWHVQVWLSFGIAASLCATALAWLPGKLMKQAFMVMGYVFSLSSVFVLSKHVRDQASEQAGAQASSPMWSLVVWAGFGLAVGLTGWGLWQMPIDSCFKAFLMVCWLFLLSSAFTLAKTLRDAHEWRLAQALVPAASASQ
jgi:hypothetical protein